MTIGVIADADDLAVVREFFELFKTPWEICQEGRTYPVVLCSGDGALDHTANLVILYGSRVTHFDLEHQIRPGHPPKPNCILMQEGLRIPIYGDTITFPKAENGFLDDEDSHHPAAFLDRYGERWVARIGYDLFAEIRLLLGDGQPPTNALVPTLELHIAFLRALMIQCGIPVVEIPPVPDGYRFIACLTHDVDHPSIRRHQWDRTTFGFLYRAVFVSIYSLFRGRMTVRSLLKNWAAACKLPLVQMGLAKDFWSDFQDGYREVEDGLRSTYFVVPFANRPGMSFRGSAPALRATRYGARDIRDTIQTAQTSGCEIGLHGIDAWLDTARAREELEEIRRVSNGAEIGVRMHWLYYDRQSPLKLEKAGAAYDATVGYNATVGYRAGTMQAYKPLETTHLLELPLHVMDTALFYPAYLGLSPKKAVAIIDRLVDNVVKWGGCLTINWHDRSLVPDRLWDACYRHLVQELKDRGAWFATATEAVSWFRKRRSVVFETDDSHSALVNLRITGHLDRQLPPLRLRTHKIQQARGTGASKLQEFFDMAIEDRVHTEARCGVNT